MDKIELIQEIGNEVCEGCGPDADCGIDPDNCSRIDDAIILLDQYISNLVTAAPDLLEACEIAIEAVFNMAPRYRKRGCFDDNDENCLCTAHVLKRAILKAKGK